jgi:hypothetical protein
MFARIVSLRLKTNSAAQYTQTIEKKVIPLLRRQKGFVDEISFLAPGGTDAVGISLWDRREHAEAYSREIYSEVLKELSPLVDGTPRVDSYEVSNSTAHHIAARFAA